MKILLAGATGLVGYEVLRQLRVAGHEVRTLSRDPARAERLRGLTSDVRTGDATAPGTLAGICDGVEVVVSALGAPIVPEAPERQSFGNVDTAANLALLAEAKRAGVRRFVYVGVFTQAAYADTAYVRAHATVEEALRTSGMEHVVVKPTGVFGVFTTLVYLARKGPIPLIGRGDAATNPVHEADVAEAIVRAATAVGAGASTIDIGGPETLTRRQIAELAFTSIGERPRVVVMPAWIMRIVGVIIGLFNRRLGELIRFMTRASTHACVAPALGTRRLADYLQREGGPTGGA